MNEQLSLSTHSVMHHRTLEDVHSAACTAGLTQSSDQPVQILQFGINPSSNEYSLLQLPNEILSAMKNDDKKLVIRGDIQDNAVLCTGSKTYELKQTVTSNSLLLCPRLHFPYSKDTYSGALLEATEVVGCIFNYMEIREMRPKLEKLKSMLWECPYKGEIEERVEAIEGAAESGKKYMFDDFLEVVQASEDEIHFALNHLQACLINDHWRLFDLEYRDQAFQSILMLLEEEDWSWKEIPFEKCCEKLRELEPPFAVEHLLKCYGVEFLNDEGERCFELLEDKVCQFFAELFLRPAGKFNFQEFMEFWPTSVPSGMTASMDQLKGLAMTDMTSMPPVIWHFPVCNLPDDPATRFTKLFSVKEKWSYEDLEPYIRDLESPGQSLNALLLKYTRVSTSGQGGKLYNAKVTKLF